MSSDWDDHDDWRIASGAIRDSYKTKDTAKVSRTYANEQIDCTACRRERCQWKIVYVPGKDHYLCKRCFPEILSLLMSSMEIKSFTIVGESK